MSITAAFTLNAAQQKQIVEAFRAKQAVNADSSKRLRELGLGNSPALKRMVATLILRKAGPDRYFLDEQVWAGKRSLSGSTAIRIALVLGLAAVAAGIYLAGR